MCSLVFLVDELGIPKTIMWCSATYYAKPFYELTFPLKLLWVWVVKIGFISNRLQHPSSGDYNCYLLVVFSASTQEIEKLFENLFGFYFLFVDM